MCGECGTPYKRVTWAKKGKKRIVWRCVSRLEFGTRYCHHSPTLDEGKLHAAILSAMNELAAVQEEVCPTVLSIAEKVRQPRSADGRSLSDWQRSRRNRRSYWTCCWRIWMIQNSTPK